MVLPVTQINKSENVCHNMKCKKCLGGSFNYHTITVFVTMWGNFPKRTFQWDLLQTLPPESLTQDLTLKFEMDWKCWKLLQGVLMPIVGAVGLAGNLLSVAVLSGKEMSNSFNKLLITLTIFDTTFIVFMVIDYTGFRGHSWFKYVTTRSLGAPRAPTSSWRPFGPFRAQICFV